jgi:uncharacterized iron-regulated membrane protein
METADAPSNEATGDPLTRRPVKRPGRWVRWVYNPHSLTFRRALFQVHLWVGIGIGLYLIFISVTGSAVVFRREFGRWFVTQDNSFPWQVRVMEWFVDLHDNLLAGTLGRDINGIFAIFCLVLVFTGAVLWWPGRTRWRRSLLPVRPSKTHRFSWHLHSAIGLWAYVLVFGWAFTGVYFAFPDAFEWAFNTFDSDPTDFERPGEAALLVLIRWHFGRFGGLGVRITWVILGLIPAVLFITGFVVWWKRLRRQAGRSRA